MTAGLLYKVEVDFIDIHNDEYIYETSTDEIIQSVFQKTHTMLN